MNYDTHCGTKKNSIWSLLTWWWFSHIMNTHKRTNRTISNTLTNEIFLATPDSALVALYGSFSLLCLLVQLRKDRWFHSYPWQSILVHKWLDIYSLMRESGIKEKSILASLFDKPRILQWFHTIKKIKSLNSCTVVYYVIM